VTEAGDKLLELGYLTFEESKKILRDDPRFKALEMNHRESTFNLAIQPFHQLYSQQLENRRQEYISILSSDEQITVHSQWSKVKKMMDEERYKEVKLKSKEKEEFFNQYISSLRHQQNLNSSSVDSDNENLRKKTDDSIRGREREIGKWREREKREMLKKKATLVREEGIAGLKSLYSETIKKPDASWRENRKKFELDARFSVTELTIEEKEKIFRDHTKQLFENRKREFRGMLVELQQTGKLNLSSTWSSISPLILSQKRYSLLTEEKEREQVFDSLMKEVVSKARQEFQQLLREKKIFITSTSGPQYERARKMLEGDKRWKQFDSLPSQERDKLMLEFDGRVSIPENEKS